MPATLSYGSQGQSVKNLQNILNFRPPSAQLPLAVDGIFGPKTQARVKEYQSRNGLVADGVVGPKTWAKLLPAPGSVPAMRPFACGNVDASNLALTHWIKQLFTAARIALGEGGAMSLKAVPTSGGGGPIRMLTSEQQATAGSVFGSSLDFSRIFISDKTGAGDRPFTVAVAIPGSLAVQIMNCGTFAPGKDTLIHELTHVWQSQHHRDPFKFMKAAVDCQAGAIVANGKELWDDPLLYLHEEHPMNYPFSAYAYSPSHGMRDLGAEQVAQACENGEADIRRKISSAAMNTHDADNETSLALLAFADRRAPGVKI